MNKLAIIPIFFLTMCGTAPVTDPPAHACSLPLDGSPANCPDERDLILVPRDKVTLPREEARGEIDITSPYHLQSLQMMFQRNMRKGQIERNATTPSDAINNALMEFNNGSNDPTKSEELLQLPSDRNQPSG
tara:strand:- start:402 stop:797 length:396 start_codon:yes stop_codon:yes gene_type:complete